MNLIQQVKKTHYMIVLVYNFQPTSSNVNLVMLFYKK